MQIAREFNADAPELRPSNLAEDNTPEWLVWQHAIKNYFVDANNDLIVLPPTAPLRETKDLIHAVDVFLSGLYDVIITTTPSAKNPTFNMVKENSNGSVTLASEPPQPVYRRQDAPKIFDITTNCYITSADFVLNHNNLFDGRVGHVVVQPETAVDIDTELDLQWAEFLMSRKCIQIER